MKKTARTTHRRESYPGHPGRPGQRGGSAPRTGTVADRIAKVRALVFKAESQGGDVTRVINKSGMHTYVRDPKGGGSYGLHELKRANPGQLGVFTTYHVMHAPHEAHADYRNAARESYPGHPGRPGQRGGSAPTKGGDASPIDVSRAAVAATYAAYMRAGDVGLNHPTSVAYQDALRKHKALYRALPGDEQNAEVRRIAVAKMNALKRARESAAKLARLGLVEKKNAPGFTITAEFRKKYGIAPKGGGPPSDYALPLPPADHPLASKFARAVLSRAGQVDASKYSPASIARQVAKAKAILAKKRGPKKKVAEAASVEFRRLGRAELRRALDSLFLRAAEAAAKTSQNATAAASADPDDDEPDADDAATDDQIKAAVQAQSALWGQLPAPPIDPEDGDSGDPEPTAIELVSHDPLTRTVTVLNTHAGKTFSASYEVDDDGNVAFRDVREVPASAAASRAVEAIRRAREAGRKVSVSRMEFREAVDVAEYDLEAGTARIIIISEGKGNPGDRHVYSADFIRHAVADKLFEGARSFLDHPSAAEERDLPERSVRRLGGWLSDVELGVDPKTGGAAAFATFHPQVGHELAVNLLRTCEEYTRKYPGESYIGFSINAYGVGGPVDIEGEQWNQVDRMTECLSVDMVTQAGARGRSISYKETGMKKTATQRGGNKTRESFIDANLDIDIRTPAERAADAKSAKLKARDGLLEAALNGSAGKKLREAIGAKPDGDLTDDEKKKLAEALGITDKQIEALAESTTGDGGAGGDEGEPEGDDADLDDEEGDELEGTDDETERLRKEAAAHKKRADEAEAKLAEARASNKSIVVDKIMDKFKVAEGKRPMARLFISEGKTEDELIERARAFVSANPSDGDTFGVVGAMRESRGAGEPAFATPSFAPEGR